MSLIDLQFTVNGQSVALAVAPHWTLLHVLRNELGLTGAKENCLEAECGVCTVLVDGAAVASCIRLAAQCQGCSITTIEGLAATGEELNPVQEAFLAHGAVQCGFCIPGMVLTAKSFLDENAGTELAEDDIREGLCGTLCRCTGYQKIVDAVAAVAATKPRKEA
jgi:carbon-monoxide dehydrogenase small subunit